MNILSQNDVNASKISDWDVDDKYLRLKKRSIRKLITLPPKYLGNLNKGIDEAIFKSTQEIFKEFNGVPIAMGKKTLLQNVGESIDDHAFIQFYVDLECIVFMPKVDKKVKAVVNKLGETYVGCLICGRINATIFKRDASLKGHKKSKNEDVDNLTDNQSGEEDPVKIQQTLNSLKTGQSVLIKIKSIQYEQNNLFIIASFVKCLE